MLNNTKTQSRPKLLFLVPAISQTHKSLENSQDFLSRPRPRPRLFFVLEVPRDQDFGLEDYITVKWSMTAMLLVAYRRMSPPSPSPMQRSSIIPKPCMQISNIPRATEVVQPIAFIRFNVRLRSTRTNKREWAADFCKISNSTAFRHTLRIRDFCV